MNTNKLTTEQLILIIILMMGLINGLMSCSSTYSNSLIKGTAHKPTKREIRKAMEYSSWEYAHPEAQVMLSGSKSRFVFKCSNK